MRSIGIDGPFVDVVRTPSIMRTPPLRLLLGAFAGVALFVQPLTVVAAPASGSAQLPDWDAAKPKPKPAELPDWDAAKPKKDPKTGKPKKPKKPNEAPAETPGETPAETPSETPSETPTETPGETPAETPAETPPAEVKPAEPTPVAEGPAEAPAVDTGGSKEALKLAKREMIAGGVLIGLGLVGFGILGAGVAVKGKAEDKLAKDPGGSTDDLERGKTMLAAGAIVGTIGVVMGLALLGEGIKDRRAARPKGLARVQVAPTFGGLMIRGRF